MKEYVPIDIKVYRKIGKLYSKYSKIKKSKIGQIEKTINNRLKCLAKSI